MIVALIEEAVGSGARRARACHIVGLSVRTVERWRGTHPQDAREGPRTSPANALTDVERTAVLALANSPAYRDGSPHQIVPRLADTGVFIASESTIYRLLRDAHQLAHRGRAQAPVRREVPAHDATGPQQVWSWDITYLHSPVRGVFWYLYLIMDIWSRRIMGWAVHPTQSDTHAATLFTTVCHEHVSTPIGLVLHADNGGPMKGATMVSTLERLGVIPSFSRPRVSDDNPYSEALFRTLTYCPAFPSQPFHDVEAARAWVTAFVAWYNHRYQHSAIQFVTPDDRHTGRDVAILAQRSAVYQAARALQPKRWSGATRDWTRPTTVYLNAARADLTAPAEAAG